RECLDCKMEIASRGGVTHFSFVSAKLKKLFDLVAKYKAEGKRIIIFSQWTKLLDLLELHFLGFGQESKASGQPVKPGSKRRRQLYKYLRFDGRIVSPDK